MTIATLRQAVALVPNAGNATKLREALEAMFEFWKVHGSAYSVRVCPVRDLEEEVEKNRVFVMEKAKAALAAPPRNCDLYADPHEAWLEWQDVCAKAFPSTGPKFHAWLFAPSTQEKGGK